MAWAVSSLAFAASSDVIDVGSRRELWIDGFLVDQLQGKAELRLHHPVAREVVIKHDRPWEGNASAYHSIFKDGDRYRMYYRGWQITFTPGKARTSNNFLCFAGSDDGIHWRRPELGLHEFQGSKANNIVLLSGTFQGVNADAGHPAVFKDENPAAKPTERYKAIIRSKKPLGLLAFASPDGLHWSPMSTAPVITDGAFDSQNLAFWDGVRGEYRAYWRYFTGGVTNDNDWKPKGIRSIRTATSKDFIHWSRQADLRYVDSPPEQLYTNAVKPYDRAPHLLIGLPQRYVERGWSDSMRALPDQAHRELKAGIVERYGTAICESLLMASRDGVEFKRWNEAFIRPGIEREGTWHYPHQLAGWHLVETKSALEGAPNELSLYAIESYGVGTSSTLRRYTLRLDGFVSAQAPMSGGEVISKPIRFAGRSLNLNFSTSAAGNIRVELQDEKGRPLPGFALEDCPPIFGDTLDRAVGWTGGGDVSALAGKPIRLRFELKDSDLFSFQFK
ncbi:MAG: hypothetical protein HY736_02290 [Verrucomicrobia bacterium]|nr:hypothetical protein [Verrucomicrobiota bacterium]